MIFLFSLAFLLAQSTVNAIPQPEFTSIVSPLSNASANSFLPSHDLGIEKDFLGQRTLLDIIWSCFATIFACTWVVVHPNIPSEVDREWRIIGRRLKIMVYTLLVPELVIYWASKQWYAAREIARNHAARGWTKTHGFFIGMGGFMLYKDGEPTRPLDITDMEDRLELSELDSWPEVSEEDILDKSKSDFFTRSVALIQTTWFVFQCITRGVLGLGLTELELVTLAFGALSGVMYFFWWDKPLDVRRPVPVHAKQTVILLFSLQGGKNGFPLESRSHLFGGESADSSSVNLKEPTLRPSYILHNSSPTLRRTRSLSSLGISSYDSISRWDEHVVSNPPRDVIPAPPSTRPLSSLSFVIQPSYLFHKSETYSRTYSIKNSINNQTAGNHRVFQTLKDAVTYPIRTFVNDLQELRTSGEILSKGGKCCTSPFYASVQLKLEHTLSIFFLLTSTVFGCMHCFAWGFNFPSTTERWLWRSSSLAVSVLPSLFGLHWVVLAKLIAPAYIHHPASRFTVGTKHLFYITSIPRLSIMLAIYTLARIALLVLPLLSLRDLSPHAYVSISWTNAIGHV